MSEDTDHDTEDKDMRKYLTLLPEYRISMNQLPELPCPKELLEDTTISRLKVQLESCKAAANGRHIVFWKKGDYGWSESYQEVVELRRKYEILISFLKESQKENNHYDLGIVENLLRELT